MEKSNATLKQDSAEQPVGVNRLIEKLGGNYEQIYRCATIFRSDVPGILLLIKRGLQQEDARQAKFACHGLRDILSTMEMKTAGCTAHMLETLIIEKKFDTARDLFPLLESEIEYSITVVERLVP